MNEKQKVEDYVRAKYGITPLDAMMEIVVLAKQNGDQQLAHAAASSAAPYVHAKLKQVEIDDKREIRPAAEVESEIASLLAGFTRGAPPAAEGATRGSAQGAGERTPH